MKCTISSNYKKNEQEKSLKITKNNQPVVFFIMKILILAAAIFVGVVIVIAISSLPGVFAQNDSSITIIANESNTASEDNFTESLDKLLTDGNNTDNSSTMQNATLSAFAQENTMLPPMQSQTPPQLKNDSSSAIVDNETANSNNDEVATEKRSSTETLTQNMELLQFETEPDDDNYLEDLEESDNYS
ncbi:MAG: hypothetical protein ACPKPY_08700 [Nitrososphaeraceae archaeon]